MQHHPNILYSFLILEDHLSRAQAQVRLYKIHPFFQHYPLIGLYDEALGS